VVARVAKGCLDALAALLGGGDGGGKDYAMGALGYLARNADNRVAIAGTKGCVAALEAFLGGGDSRGTVFASWARAILALIADNAVAIFGTENGTEEQLGHSNVPRRPGCSLRPALVARGGKTQRRC
jgi:hypothetical protein